MKTLKIKSDAEYEVPNKELYLYKDGLFIIGFNEAEAETFLTHPILSMFIENKDYEIVDVEPIQRKLEEVEWEILELSKKPPFPYFDLIYEV